MSTETEKQSLPPPQEQLKAEKISPEEEIRRRLLSLVLRERVINPPSGSKLEEFFNKRSGLYESASVSLSRWINEIPLLPCELGPFRQALEQALAEVYRRQVAPNNESILDPNERATIIQSYPPTELIGLFIQILTPDDLTMVAPIIEKLQDPNLPNEAKKVLEDIVNAQVNMLYTKYQSEITDTVNQHADEIDDAIIRKLSDFISSQQARRKETLPPQQPLVSAAESELPPSQESALSSSLPPSQQESPLPLTSEEEKEWVKREIMSWINYTIIPSLPDLTNLTQIESIINSFRRNLPPLAKEYPISTGMQVIMHYSLTLALLRKLGRSKLKNVSLTIQLPSLTFIHPEIGAALTELLEEETENLKRKNIEITQETCDIVNLSTGIPILLGEGDVIQEESIQHSANRLKKFLDYLTNDPNFNHSLSIEDINGLLEFLRSLDLPSDGQSFVDALCRTFERLKEFVPEGQATPIITLLKTALGLRDDQQTIDYFQIPEILLNAASNTMIPPVFYDKDQYKAWDEINKLGGPANFKLSSLVYRCISTIEQIRRRSDSSIGDSINLASSITSFKALIDNDFQHPRITTKDQQEWQEKSRQQKTYAHVIATVIMTQQLIADVVDLLRKNSKILLSSSRVNVGSEQNPPTEFLTVAPSIMYANKASFGTAFYFPPRVAQEILNPPPNTPSKIYLLVAPHGEGKSTLLTIFANWGAIRTGVASDAQNLLVTPDRFIQFPLLPKAKIICFDEANTATVEMLCDNLPQNGWSAVIAINKIDDLDQIVELLNKRGLPFSYLTISRNRGWKKDEEFFMSIVNITSTLPSARDYLAANAYVCKAVIDRFITTQVKKKR